MNRIARYSVCLALLVTVAGCAAGYSETEVRASMGSPRGDVDLSYFYDNLSSDGEWFREPGYGWCWTPYDVSADWRPYYDGHWEYTDYGWSWASNEPWGWATYHYGRWFFDDSYGWVWVPGTEWAPAWVAWRYGDDWVGWAPLPPTAGWDASAGLAFGDADAIPSEEWCFVPREHVLDASLSVRITSVARNVTLIERSRDATRFEVRAGRPANVGIDVGQIEAVVGRPVRPVRIIDAPEPRRGGGQPAGRGFVGYFRPRVRPAPPEQAPPNAVVEGRYTIPDDVLQRRRDEQQRKLENDLNAERARLQRDQQDELRARGSGPDGSDEIRRRHETEQRAFEVHAERLRRVLEQRFQKQIVKPDKSRNDGNQDGNGNGNGRGRGRGRDRGQGDQQDHGGD